MPSAAPDREALTRDAVARRLGGDACRRFADDLRALGYDGGDLAVAVSGGTDSTALLLLAIAATPAGSTVRAATVDHGLRSEAAAEATQVAQLCATLGIRHDTLAIIMATTRGGPQARAREARYAALSRWCAKGWLLVAHHRDDVAETLLMRLARGSGIAGLGRMRGRFELGDGGVVTLRPLLHWPKTELVEICARAGLTPVRDPSNDDPRFDRTRARTLLASTPWLDGRQLARSAANLSDASAALDWLAERMWQERVVVASAMSAIDLDATGLPHDTTRRLVDRIMDRLAGRDADRRIETMIAMLDAGEHAMLADVQAVPGPVWRFRRAPPRRAG